MNGMEQGVSLIICCHNGEKRIPAVLDHISAQVFHKNSIPWEVLVIDNASTDNTSKIAYSSWKGESGRLRVLYEPQPGLSFARMCGINNARYEFLSFIDDDNWVETNWVEKVHNIMSAHNNVAICGGLGEAVFESEPPYWFDEYQHAFAVGPQSDEHGILKNDLFLYGAGSTMRKSAITELFDRGFEFMLTGRKGKGMSSGDDFEFCLGIRMLGYDLYYEPDLKFKHAISSNRLDPNYLKRLCAAFGRSHVILELYKSVLLKYPYLKFIKTRNRYLCVLMAFYSLIKISGSIPVFILTGKSKDQRFKNMLSFYFALNDFKEKVRLFPAYNRILQSIITLKMNCQCSKT